MLRGSGFPHKSSWTGASAICASRECKVFCQEIKCLQMFGKYVDYISEYLRLSLTLHSIQTTILLFSVVFFSSGPPLTDKLSIVKVFGVKEVRPSQSPAVEPSFKATYLEELDINLDPKLSQPTIISSILLRVLPPRPPIFLPTLVRSSCIEFVYDGTNWR